jgi:hypothetical protein
MVVLFSSSALATRCMPSITRLSGPMMIGMEVSTCLEQAEVLDNFSHRGTLRLIKPVDRVDLEEILKAHFLHRQPCGQHDQSIHIPGIQPDLALPEVVLLTHLFSVVQTREQNQGTERVSS